MFDDVNNAGDNNNCDKMLLMSSNICRLENMISRLSKDIDVLKFENGKLHHFVHEMSSGGNMSRCIEHLEKNIKNETNLEVFSPVLYLGREIIYRYNIKAFLDAKRRVLSYYLRWLPTISGRVELMWPLTINITLKIIHPARFEKNKIHIYLKKQSCLFTDPRSTNDSNEDYFI